MRKFIGVLLVLLTFSAIDFAQTSVAPTSTFNINAQAIALPGNKSTVPGTIVGATLAITPNFQLRNDNLMTPGGLQAYFGGFQYTLPILSTKLNNASPVLNGNNFQFYVTGSVGIDSVPDAVVAGQSDHHYAALFGGGVNYDPTGTGHFSVNLIEVRAARLPGFANGLTTVVSGGLKIGFGGTSSGQ